MMAADRDAVSPYAQNGVFLKDIHLEEPATRFRARLVRVAKHEFVGQGLDDSKQRLESCSHASTFVL